MRISYRIPVLILFGFVLPSCAASSRQTPLPTTRVDTGSQTVEEARRVLQGTWALVSLEVNAPDGRQATVAAGGTLVSDAFGNLSIEYKVSPEGLKALESVGLESPNPVISTKGRVVIDPSRRMITYLPPDAAGRAFDPALAAARNNPFALERPRYYSLGDDGILTLSTRYDDGKDAAVGRWKKS